MKTELTQILLSIKQTHLKLNIPVAEWTNISNIPFIKVALHSTDSKMFNLGLTKINGLCNAEEKIPILTTV